jgi:hypothetical protein
MNKVLIRKLVIRFFAFAESQTYDFNPYETVVVLLFIYSEKFC